MFSIALIAFTLISSVLTLDPPSDENDCQNTTFREDLRGSYFSPEWPTCANDVSLSYFLGSTKPNVKVQPDCDAAIAAACGAVHLMFNLTSEHPDPILLNTKSVSSSCEVTILWPIPSVIIPGIPYDYDPASCVAELQRITETCMLIGTGKYAKKGSQAGVINLFYQHHYSGSIFTLYAPSGCNDQPAYMAGPPGYFPDKINQYSAPEAITTDCLVHDNCPIL